MAVAKKIQQQMAEAGLEVETTIIRQFSTWCAAAGIDEWSAFLKMTGGDHAAMALLRFALLWSGMPAVQAAGGWFYRTAKQFESDVALSRTLLERARKCLQSRLGMQEERRRVRLPGGDLLLKSPMHYRLDPVILRAAFDLYCLEESARTVCKSHAELQRIIDRQLLVSSTSQVMKTNTSQLREIDKWEVREIDNSEVRETSSSQVQQTSASQSSESSSKSSSKTSSKSSLSKKGASGDAEREMVHPEKINLPAYLGKLFDRLGTPNGKTAKILEQCRALGDSTSRAVAEKCEDKANSWQYVLNALVNEAKKPEVQVQIAGRARDEENNRLWREEQAAGLIGEPVNIFNAPLLKMPKRPAAYTGAGSEVWAMAHEQLRLQIDEQKFETCLRDAVLVGVSADRFTIDVTSEPVREILQNRLKRVVCKALEMALGRKPEVLFVTAKNHVIGSGDMVGAVAG